MNGFVETVGWIGVVCWAGWLMFPSLNEAGELREGKPNRMTTAQAPSPQAAKSNGTSLLDSLSEKPRRSEAPPDEPRISETVEGNTILEQAKIEAILEPYKGSDRRLSDIESARSELEKAYHTAGYPTVV